MTSARSFVAALSEIALDGVFNPYRDRCLAHDRDDAPAVRRKNLRGYLDSIERIAADTIWMGRDLGYRGGRRTGLALTDEQRLAVLPQSYPGALPTKATRGPLVAERTAAEIWAVLERLEHPPMLWNVFPLHPHEPGAPLSNRRFTSRELAQVNDLNHTLVSWLKIKRVICIGQDAAAYASTLGVIVECVRHPSYGGVNEFRAGMQRIYGPQLRGPSTAQPALF